MKNLLIVFSALFITGYVFTIADAKQSPTIDEIDALLTKVSKNIESAGECTKMAQTMNAKMVGPGGSQGGKVCKDHDVHGC